MADAGPGLRATDLSKSAIFNTSACSKVFLPIQCTSCINACPKMLVVLVFFINLVHSCSQSLKNVLPADDFVASWLHEIS
jgi:hypothetical protein